jgi:regulator of PEP synthase PpsR (kinase-PPPase family)
MTPAQPVIVVISDSTGETAEQAGKAALAQFGLHDEGVVRTFPNILTLKALEKTIIRAKKEGALVVYTLVGLELRSNIRTLAETHGVTAVDLIGGLIRGLTAHIGRPPLSVPGLSHELSEEYFRRIAAVEFSITNDDGKNPQNLPKAEIVLVGISRASKTPLSNYIAGRGYKVANVPIVMGLPLPEQLYQVDPERVFALTINPSILMKIRKARLASLQMGPDSDYGDLGQIRREVIYAQRLYAKQPEWSVIDMSTKAVEEAASLIIALYRRRFPSGEEAAAPAPRRKKKAAKKRATKKRAAKKRATKNTNPRKTGVINKRGAKRASPQKTARASARTRKVK